ncbi:MAG TPA: PLP-dependent transferase, partial [Gaiellaceae bacterium]|nr:PLP-dependent transferase [Gaiellaceae bacterium]
MTTPVDRSTTWPYENGEPGEFTYSRYSSPTMAEAESRLGALDGGKALLFASGMAAETALAMTFLSPGQTVALAEGSYYGTGVMLDELARWGVRKVEFDQTGAPPDADLIWLEAPSNPFLTMPNFEASAAHPARVVCDATAATPLNVRPLELGCDFVIHSATKFLSGHDDALAGVVVCKRADDAARLLEFRSRTGPVASADTAWILMRGLSTLEVRVARQTASAKGIAERLRAHTAVLTVRYPGFGALLSFDVADAEAARRVETAT